MVSLPPPSIHVADRQGRSTTTGTPSQVGACGCPGWRVARTSLTTSQASSSASLRADAQASLRSVTALRCVRLSFREGWASPPSSLWMRASCGTRSSDELVGELGYFSGDRMPSSAARSSSSFRRRSSRAATSLSRLAASTAAFSAAINGVTIFVICCGDSFAK